MKTPIIIIPALALLFCSCADTTSTTTSTTQQVLASPITDFAAQALGAGGTIAIILEANPSNKQGTAQDILTVDAALLTLLNGSVPTASQATAIAQSFKSDSSTTGYISLAQTLSTAFATQIQAWSNSGATAADIKRLGTDFITGSQLMAQGYVGVAK